MFLFKYRFFEYADASAEDAAIDGLTGMRLGDKVLGVKRATADYGMPGAAWVPPIGSTPGFAPGSLPGTETECVRLTNMVSLFLVIFGYFWLFFLVIFISVWAIGLTSCFFNRSPARSSRIRRRRVRFWKIPKRNARGSVS